MARVGGGGAVSGGDPAGGGQAGGGQAGSGQAGTVEEVLGLLNGFRAAKFLMVGCELGVFEALADSPGGVDVGALAERVGVSRRAGRICADALVAIGLLAREGDRYRNAPAARHLSGESGVDLRAFVRFTDRVSYPAWGGLAEALRSGPVNRITALSAEQQEVFSSGVEALNAGPAAAIAASGHLVGRRALLDVGGGTGSWSAAAVRAHGGLRATVVEWPPVAELARRRVADAGLGGRIDVVAGDVRVDPMPQGHDCCLLANVVHVFSPEDNELVLANARRAVVAGARLLLVDYWTGPTGAEPAVAALMAGEFAVNSEDGDVYGVDDVVAWLGATGWRFLGREAVAGAKSAVVAEAV
ncbi:O-methyltransferase family 2 [Actinosynnema mirum DSM 43827]|uniref:O-methyltransferase family 2 n=1 Tax=Actinosynnema mirum (strain ATCC 29888 / DSM 43827 / JCM 3225 / NBRC 14064 / NCIMB 13271 / NRRL B-12336 / IMRU 3971 / 101) TaxID=446462 RepID=C6WFZ7_ACTMD|nr:O-methyltransferase family 2 [Actinosynnema mirum DSM 43827]